MVASWGGKAERLCWQQPADSNAGGIGQGRAVLERVDLYGCLPVLRNERRATASPRCRRPELPNQTGEGTQAICSWPLVMEATKTMDARTPSCGPPELEPHTNYHAAGMLTKQSPTRDGQKCGTQRPDTNHGVEQGP